ncbi:N-acetylmuramoyl-L-alanine amidase [Alteribacter populi]|uniref:N-acetylmuramoyl-L-alanine amidase n=1 Tax=Alteribacter populi TaxID=2011011 RepID=UPI000BBB4110|nr:N-acetylmuramoyl-L-alanine amidase [Alteribacter populi]
MTMIVIDPGHGGTDSGATYQGFKEKDIALTIGILVRDYLKANYLTDVIMTRTTDTTVSLSERTRIANSNQADYFCSIHNNIGGGTGFESYIYNGTVPEQTIQIRSKLHDHIMDGISKKTVVNDQGKKNANFHVLRETEMSASLLEGLFVDNDQDLQLLQNHHFITDVAKTIADGMANALSLTVKKQNDQIHKIIAGAFSNRENANKRVDFLQNNGILSFVFSVEINEETMYRVQSGAFKNQENAEKHLQVVKDVGITDAYILTEQIEDNEEGEPILGDIHLSAAYLNQFVRTINPEAPSLGQFYIQYGTAYGISSDIAFAQALHETDYFRFTGIVKEKQNNFAGIGATDPENPGASFETPEEGVHAHIQHLYAYASTHPIPEGYPLVDPRFGLVERGSATTWVGLNGKWAVPGTTYGQSILSLYQSMVEFAIEQLTNRIEH